MHLLAEQNVSARWKEAAWVLGSGARAVWPWASWLASLGLGFFSLRHGEKTQGPQARLEGWTGKCRRVPRWLSETDGCCFLPQVPAALASGSRSWGSVVSGDGKPPPHPCQITLPLCPYRERERPQVLEGPSSTDPEKCPKASEAQHQCG